MSVKLIFNVLACTLLGLVLFLGGSYIYSAYFEQPFLSYRDMPFKVPGIITAGSPTGSAVMRCSSASSTRNYTTTRSFQKIGAGQPPFLLPSVEVTIEPGCNPATSRMTVVPDNTPPGYYRFSGVASVPGLFVTHKVGWNTEFFEVVAKPVKETEVIVKTETVKIEVEK